MEAIRQYYFGTKEELLLAAMRHLLAQFADRAMARVREAGGPDGPASPRDVIAAILAEALPADDERRTFQVLNMAYVALSLTDPALAMAPLAKDSGTVNDVVAAQLRAAQAAGDTPARLDPGLEASTITAATPLHRISDHTSPAAQVSSDIVGQNTRYNGSVHIS